MVDCTVRLISLQLQLFLDNEKRSCLVNFKISEQITGRRMKSLSIRCFILHSF